MTEGKNLRLVLDIQYILVFSRVCSLNMRTFECFWRFLSQVFISLLLILKAVSIIASKPELQAIAIEIFEVCMSFDIAMEIEWLPRSQNDKADYLSRIVDLDDWSMSAAFFQLVDSSWGPHTVDRFASFYNAQVP